MNRQSRSIGSRNRRSSILKLDLNRDDETTGILFNKSRGQSRRVSFAETAQIKEFARDSPRVWRHDSDSPDEGNNKENEPSKNNSAGVSITGLDSLLNGEIETQSYQAIVNYPIQEMSADSFSIGAGNKTVLGEVDMETTLCVESEIGYSPFEPEPSMELKFEAPSFLASLKSQSECMSPMQIYRSPRENTERSRLFHEMDHEDAENIPPVTMDMFMEDPRRNLVDSKSFLCGWISAKNPQSDANRSQEQEEMDETFSYGSVIPNQSFGERRDEEFGGLSDRKWLQENRTIHWDDLGRVEETACIGGILDTNKLKVTNTRVTDVDQTKLFENEDPMEETRCHGSIVKLTTPAMEETKSVGAFLDDLQGNRTLLWNDLGRVEETACIGGILDTSKLKVNNTRVTDKNHIQLFDNEDPMEETRCHGSIVKMTAPAMEETKSVGAILENRKSGHEVMPSGNQTFVGNTTMEETRSVGAIVENRTSGYDLIPDRNHTVIGNTSMEETRSMGGILKERLGVDEGIPDTNKTLVGNITMEETKSLGGILKNKIQLNEDNRSLVGDTVRGVNTPRENNTSEQGEVDVPNKAKIPSCLDTDTSKLKVNNTRVTDKNHIQLFDNEDPMEETRCHGSIVKMTAPAMEETKSVGAMLENRKSGLEVMPSGNQTFVGNTTMEETRSVGAIVENRMSGNDLIPARNHTVVGNTSMEETGSMGGILKERLGVDEGIPDTNKTLVGNVTMEETKSLGGILKNKIQLNEDSRSLSNKLNMNQWMGDTGVNTPLENNTSEQVEVDLPNKATIPSCLDSGKTCLEDTLLNRSERPLNTDSDYQQVIPDLTDTEITFKTTNKRTLSEIQTKEPVTERTRDLTTSMKKIKEMLLMSAQKSASQNKTPKHLTGTEAFPSPTHSPAHKRKRLFDTQATEPTGNPDDLGVSSLAAEDGGAEKYLSMGIVDETMPECMQTELLSTTTGISDTQTETGFFPNTTLRPNDSRTTSSGNLCDQSNLSNMSMAKTFVAPDGPLSLETFYKLTARPLSIVKGDARCSILPSPRIDFDCIEEVLEADIVNGPLVAAKNKMFDRMKERKRKNEENIVWLTKTLEETQPQLFQDVAKGDTEVIKEITNQLYVLFSCCSKEAKTVWIQEIKGMFEETVGNIENEGHHRIESLQQKVKTQAVTADQLLCSLDNDLEALDDLESQLKETEETKNKYESELNLVVEEVKKNEELIEELKRSNEESRKGQMLQATRAALRRQICVQLLFTEYNLEEFEEDHVCFAFLEDEVVLRIDFEDGPKENAIKRIDIQSRLKPDCRWLHKKVGHSLLFAAIDKDLLLAKYTDFSSLPKMLQEISAIVNEINSISSDIRVLNKQNKLFWDGKMLSFELWNIEMLRLVQLFVTISHEVNSSSTKLPITVHVKRLIGDVSVPEVEKCLQDIDQGSNYMCNLVHAVNSQLSKTLSNGVS